MERETKMFIFLGAIAILAILIFYWVLRNLSKEKATTALVKAEYDKALRDGNKALALQLGREYYSRLRGGYLTVYDEQAIANDLSTID